MIIQKPNFSVWKTAEIGVYRLHADIRKSLKHLKVFCGATTVTHFEGDPPEGVTAREFHDILKRGKKITIDLLDQIVLSPKKISIPLYKVELFDLGFTSIDDVPVEEFWRVAEAKGFGRCPDDVIPQVCHLYSEQPSGEWAVIMTNFFYTMNPFRNCPPCASLFILLRDEGVGKIRELWENSACNENLVHGRKYILTSAEFAAPTRKPTP